MSKPITQEYLKSILHYDPDTGIFTWRKRNDVRPCWNNMFAGKKAGCRSPRGYILISINDVIYQSHRLAFMWITGRFPKHFIDHINGDKSDNRWLNIREATNSQNQMNRGKPSANTSGFKGVYYNKNKRKYEANIIKDGKKIYIGRADTPEEAGKMYQEKAKELQGEFAYTGETA